MKRRTALALLGGTSLALQSAPTLIGAQGAQARESNGHLNPDNADDLYVIHRKLNYTFDDRLVFWFIEAVRNGLVDSQFTPLWNMHVGFISSIKDLDDDRFEVRTMSSIFYSDLERKALLETFDNPYTGERIDVRQPSLGVSVRTFDRKGMIASRTPRPGMTMDEYGDVGPAWVIGDDVWCRGDTGFRAEPIGDDGRLLQVNDWTTFHGSIREVSDPDVKSAHSTKTFNDINTWPSWLNMGDHPGNYVSRGFGRKSWSIEDMPDIWQLFMRDRYPKEYLDPRARIEA